MLKYKYQMWTFTGCWHVILSLHSGGSFPRSTLYDKIKGIMWLCIYLILSYYAYFDFMISALCYINSTMAQWRQLVTYIWVNLAQVMACCLMTPSHYLNQCWLIINHSRPFKIPPNMNQISHYMDITFSSVITFPMDRSSIAPCFHTGHFLWKSLFKNLKQYFKQNSNANDRTQNQV